MKKWYLLGVIVLGLGGVYLADAWGIGWFKGYILELIGFFEFTLLFALGDALRKHNE